MKGRGGGGDSNLQIHEPTIVSKQEKQWNLQLVKSSPMQYACVILKNSANTVKVFMWHIIEKISSKSRIPKGYTGCVHVCVC